MNRSVLIIGNFLSGAENSRGVCEGLAERLAGNGWRVLTASHKRPRLLRLADMILTTLRHRQQYSVAQIDVFSGPAFFWAEAVGWTLRRLGKPFVLTLHGGNLPQFAARWPGRVSRLLASADAVTAPSRYLKEGLEEHRADIRVTPNPIDLNLYPYREHQTAGPRLMWLRAFHEIYNPSMAVKVVAALMERFPEVQLTMVGPDKHDGSLERSRTELRNLGVNGRIRFLGQVPKKDVPRVLSAADIFLNTSNVDNAPVSLIEAMACGLCIVSTNVGGITYLCKHGSDALLVAPNDAQGMVLAVTRILLDPVLSAGLSRNARAKAEQFGWLEVLPEWDRLLTTTASNHRASRAEQKPTHE